MSTDGEGEREFLARTWRGNVSHRACNHRRNNAETARIYERQFAFRSNEHIQTLRGIFSEALSKGREGAFAIECEHVTRRLKSMSGSKMKTEEKSKVLLRRMKGTLEGLIDWLFIFGMLERSSDNLGTKGDSFLYQLASSKTKLHETHYFVFVMY